MNKVELATKLAEVMQEINPYEYMDNEYDVEKAMRDLENSPLEIIENLVEYIESWL